MQYLYTQEEHDRFATDKAAIEKRVAAAVEVKLAEARKRTLEVIENFFATFKADLGGPFANGPISYHSLKKFSDLLREANQLPKESCDKKA